MVQYPNRSRVFQSFEGIIEELLTVEKQTIPHFKPLIMDIKIKVTIYKVIAYLLDRFEFPAFKYLKYVEDGFILSFQIVPTSSK